MTERDPSFTPEITECNELAEMLRIATQSLSKLLGVDFDSLPTTEEVTTRFYLPRDESS